MTPLPEFATTAQLLEHPVRRHGSHSAFSPFIVSKNWRSNGAWTVLAIRFGYFLWHGRSRAGGLPSREQHITLFLA